MTKRGRGDALLFCMFVLGFVDCFNDLVMNEIRFLAPTECNLPLIESTSHASKEALRTRTRSLLLVEAVRVRPAHRVEPMTDSSRKRKNCTQGDTKNNGFGVGSWSAKSTFYLVRYKHKITVGVGKFASHFTACYSSLLTSKSKPLYLPSRSSPCSNMSAR